MILNQQQLKLLKSMIQYIHEFREGELQFFEFVGKLEGALDAGQFEDRQLIERWYDYWTPLEVLRAENGNNVTIADVDNNLNEMELFLKSVE